MNKKAVFIANSAWYLNNFRKNTFLRFMQEGYQVVVLCPENSGEAVLDYVDEVHTFVLERSGTHPVREALSLLQIKRSLKQIKPDIVFSFNPKTNLYSLMATRASKLPVVVNVSGLGEASSMRGVVGSLYNGLVKKMYRKASHVFFQNGEDMQAMVAENRYLLATSELIPGSGVDLTRFKPTPVNPPEARVFVMAARLVAKKGVVQYLKAANLVAEKYPNCQFLLAGVPEDSDRGVSVDEVNSLASRANVRYLGKVDDVTALLARADVSVLPSVYPEGVPRALLEGLASGHMIVTTDRPGCRLTVVEEKNGMLVDGEDVSQLAKAFETIAVMPTEQATEWSDYSRNLAQSQFDENIVIERYLDVAKSNIKATN